MIDTNIQANPFPGLKSFEVTNSHLFFGREPQTDELLRKLKTARFLAVIGASGSGKSSLIKSGIVPELQKGFEAQGGSNWKVAIFTPGSTPITNMAKALAARNVLHPDIKMEPNYPNHIESVLRRSSLGLVEAMREAKLQGSNLMLVINQFEELFTLSKSADEKNKRNDSNSFVNLILTAIKQKEFPIYIILTMRSEFLGATTNFRGLPEAINEGQYLIPRMTRQDLRRVIMEPPNVCNVALVPRLRGRILNDIEDSNDQLPILQHGLMRTWAIWEGLQETAPDDNLSIDIKHYEQIGTLSTALNQHAEEAYEELTEEQSKICEKIFRAITDASQGVNNGMSRSVDITTLAAISQKTVSEVIKIIEVFNRPDRAFITANEERLGENTIVKLTHECLIRKWERLRTWAEEEVISAETYIRLANAATFFFQGKSALWRDPELQLALKWREKNEPNQAWANRYHTCYNDAIEFLDKSEEAYGLEMAQKEEERQNKLRAARRFNIAVGIFGLVCLLLMGWAVYANFEASKSQKLAEVKAEEAELAAQNAERQRVKADIAAALALEKEEEAKIQAEKARIAGEIAKEEAAKAKIAEDEAKVQAEKARIAGEIAKEEAAKAKIAEDEAIKKANEARIAEEKANRLKMQSLAKAIALKSISIQDNPSLRALVSRQAYNILKDSDPKAVSTDPDIYSGLYFGLKELEKEHFNEFPANNKHRGAVRAIETDKKGNYYTTGSDGKILKWSNVKWGITKKPTGKFTTFTQDANTIIMSLAVSPDGKKIATGGKNKRVKIYNTQSSIVENTLNLHRDKSIWKVVFVPKQNAIISTGEDRRIMKYDLKSKKLQVLNIKSKAQTKNIVISPTGSYIFTGNDYGEISTLRLNGNSKPIVTKTNNGSITAMAISPNGRYLSVGTKSGQLLIYTVKGGKISKLRTYKAHNATISDIKFNKKSNKFATASYDRKAKLWSITDIRKLGGGYKPIAFEDHTSWCMSVAFNSNESQVIVACRDGAIKFWNPSTNVLAKSICDNVNLKRKTLNNVEWERYIGKDIEQKNICQ